MLWVDPFHVFNHFIYDVMKNVTLGLLRLVFRRR